MASWETLLVCSFLWKKKKKLYFCYTSFEGGSKSCQKDSHTCCRFCIGQYAHSRWIWVYKFCKFRPESDLLAFICFYGIELLWIHGKMGSRIWFTRVKWAGIYFTSFFIHFSLQREIIRWLFIIFTFISLILAFLRNTFLEISRSLISC